MFYFIFIRLLSILLHFSYVSHLNIPWNFIITSIVVILRCHIFLIYISRPLYLLISLYSLTNMLLFFGTTISSRKHIFLLLFLTTISGLMVFIFVSAWIAESQRIVAPFVSFNDSGWCLYHFSQSNIP